MPTRRAESPRRRPPPRSRGRTTPSSRTTDSTVAPSASSRYSPLTNTFLTRAPHPRTVPGSARRARRAASAPARARPPTSPVSGASSTPLRQWPVAQTSPSSSPGPTTGRVVRRARAAARRRRSTSSSSPTSGTTSQAASNSRYTPSAVTAVSKPCSSTSRPAPRARRRAERGSSAACARSARSGGSIPARRPQLEDLALDRAHRRAPRPSGAGRGSTRRRPPRPRRTRPDPEWCARRTRPPVELDRAHLDSERDLVDHRGERAHGRARVGLRLVVGQDPAGDARRQSRLEAPAAARRQPFDVQPERALKLVQPPQRLGVVAIRGHHRAPLSRYPVGSPLRSSSSAANAGQRSRPRQVDPQQALLAEVGLRHRREHARPPRARPRRPARSRDRHEHGQAASLQRARRRPGR